MNDMITIAINREEIIPRITSNIVPMTEKTPILSMAKKKVNNRYTMPAMIRINNATSPIMDTLIMSIRNEHKNLIEDRIIGNIILRDRRNQNKNCRISNRNEDHKNNTLIRNHKARDKGHMNKELHRDHKILSKDPKDNTLIMDRNTTDTDLMDNVLLRDRKIPDKDHRTHRARNKDLTDKVHLKDLRTPDKDHKVKVLLRDHRTQDKDLKDNVLHKDRRNQDKMLRDHRTPDKDPMDSALLRDHRIRDRMTNTMKSRNRLGKVQELSTSVLISFSDSSDCND